MWKLVKSRSFEKLERELLERELIEKTLRRKAAMLDMRVKELDCLYNISQFFEKPGISPEEIIQGTLSYIPQAYQHPEFISGRIVFEGREFTAENFQETPLRKTIRILFHGRESGMVEICLLDEHPVEAEESFNPEDNRFLKAVAGRLGKIIERIRAVDDLDHVESRYRELFDNMSSGVAVYDVAGDGKDFLFKDFNKAGEKIDRISKKELIGRSVVELFPYTKKIGLLEVFRRVWKTGKPESHPVVFYEDERIRGWRKNYVYRLNSGEIVTVYDDVSLQKEAEEALKESEEKFKSISAYAQDAVIMMDHEGGISFWNQAAEHMFGWTARDVLGRNLHDIIVPESYREDQRKGFTHFQKTGRGTAVGQVMRLRAIHQKGHEFPVELSLASVKLKGKWCAIGIVRDITDREKAEKEIEEAKKRAEVAHVAKSEFLTNMSHEIRTPMNGIIGMTGLLLETDLTPEQKDYAETVKRSADGLLAIIDDILDYSKIESGEQDLNIMDFDLETTLKEMHSMMAIRAQEKGLKFSAVIEPCVPKYLRGDPSRLRRILTNLIGNAVKFTSSGEITVSVRLEKEDDKTALLHFSISDTGPGIPSEKKSALFDAFTQADTSLEVF